MVALVMVGSPAEDTSSHAALRPAYLTHGTAGDYAGPTKDNQECLAPEVCEAPPHTSGTTRSPPPADGPPDTGWRRPWTRWPPSLQIFNEQRCYPVPTTGFLRTSLPKRGPACSRTHSSPDKLICRNVS